MISPRTLLPALILLVSISGLPAQKDAPAAKSNRLAKEKSPYLLQHAQNPVDWYPWGKEAFEKARKEKKLILLSIGYSTCHWCHVMERESFENEEIARFLNQHFVAIKLDREERPDVDQVYMTAYQAMTQQGGGWPLNMFLTPTLKPLTGGTYFPPEERNGQPGFPTVLKQIQSLWETKREEIIEQSDTIHQKMEQHFKENQAQDQSVAMDQKIIDGALAGILAQIDPVWGGLGEDTKFPRAGVFRFLLQSGNPEAIEAALKTCRRMRDGGIHDHVMGGFHRYAVDREWLIPHFEKMLYDQAQLMELYLDAWQVSGDESFRAVVEGIADYVLRDLSHPQGGFYCAQDAQSEGKEGKCFCWTVDELSEILTKEELRAARDLLGVTDAGNFLDQSDPVPLRNQNILSFQKPRQELTQEEGQLVKTILEKLGRVRTKRIPPATDDKVLASWNGLMIGAMARAGRVLGNEKYLKAARRAHAFIKTKLWDEKSKRLSHRWRDGEKDDSAQAQSYLLMLRGSRMLYEADLNPEDLAFAITLAEQARTLFYDPKNGGFYQGEKRDDLVLRLKGQYDGALPAESAVASREFAVLSHITGRKDFQDVATLTLKSDLPLINESPVGTAEMLMSLGFALTDPGKLVLAGAEGRRDLILAAAAHFDPHRIVLGNKGKVSEFSAGLPSIDGKSTAYYCVNQSCQLPVNSPGELSKLLVEMEAAKN